MQSHARVELAISRSGKVTFSLSLQLDARLFPVRLPCLEFVGTKGRSGMEIGFLWFSASFLGVLQFFRHRGFKNSDNFMVAMFPTVFQGLQTFRHSLSFTHTLLNLHIAASKNGKSVKKIKLPIVKLPDL